MGLIRYSSHGECLWATDGNRWYLKTSKGYQPIKEKWSFLDVSKNEPIEDLCLRGKEFKIPMLEGLSELSSSGYLYLINERLIEEGKKVHIRIKKIGPLRLVSGDLSKINPLEKIVEMPCELDVPEGS